MEDLNASYGSYKLLDYPVGDAPPENIFEEQRPLELDPNLGEQNLNNSFQAASKSQELLDHNDSAASGEESTGSNLESSFGLQRLFLHGPPVDLTPPDDLFEVGNPHAAENKISVGSSRANLSELLTPGSPGTIHEIFGSAVDPVEELHNEQASSVADGDASNSSGTVTCPGRSPTFSSESECDQMVQVGKSTLGNAQSLETNLLSSFQSTGSIPEEPELSFAQLEAVAAIISREHSSNFNDLMELATSLEAQSIETYSVPSTVSLAVPQPESHDLHGNLRHEFSTDSVPSAASLAFSQPASLDLHGNLQHEFSADSLPSAASLAVPQPASLDLHGNIRQEFPTDSVPSAASPAVSQPTALNLHGNLPHEFSTDFVPSTTSEAVLSEGSLCSGFNQRRNSMPDSEPSSAAHAVSVEGSPYSRRNTRRSSMNDAIPSSPLQGARQEGSPYSRRNTRRSSVNDAIPSSPLQAARQEGSPYPRRNPRRNSTRSAPSPQLINSYADIVTPRRFRNESSPNSIEPNESSSNTMEVSEPLVDPQPPISVVNLASVITPLPSALDNPSSSPTSGRKITRCPLCSTLRFIPQSSTETDSELCMSCTRAKQPSFQTSVRKITRCPLCSTIRFLPQSATDTDSEICMSCQALAARQ